MKPTLLVKIAGIVVLLAAIVIIVYLLMPGASTPAGPAPIAHGPETRPAGEPLFTLSPETTAITAPLHPDGTPDYVAAMNARYGQGVTPENNVFTGWLEVMGTGDGMLPASTRDAILVMAGAQPSDARWMSFEEYCAKHNHPELGAESPGLDAEQRAERQPWKDDQFPIVAAFLKERGTVLDAAKQAWSRPRYWLPAIAMDGRSVDSVLLPGLGTARDLANALCARAMQHAGDGDFDGYLSDLLAARHIARLLFTGTTTIERLVAAGVESMTDRTIAAACAAGIFSADQCGRLSAALEPDPPSENVSEAMNQMERWSVLDTTLLIATNQVDILQKMLDAKTYRALSTIDADAVDWDTVLTQLNATINDWTHALQQPLLEDVAAAAEEIKHKSAAFHVGRAADLSPREDESRQQYTARIAAAISSQLIPDLTRAQQLCREAHMQYAMAQALVAVARHHALTRQWPKSLEQLVPKELAALPTDIYSIGGQDPVNYLLTPNGPALYSVGRNHLDDGGLRNASGQDDIAVGAPIPAPDAPPLP